MLSTLTDSVVSPRPTFMTLETVEKMWIDASRQTPAAFIEYMSEKTLARHHVEWLVAIFGASDDPAEIRDRINIIAFPGSGKTTIINYTIAWMIGKYPQLTHIICSVSEDQAKDRLNDIREIIEDQRYQNVFPHIHLDTRRPNNSTRFSVWSSRWKNSQNDLDYAHWRRLIRKHGHPKDHTLFAAGVTSRNIIGKRISGFAVLDDPHSEENSSTEQQRAKVYLFVVRTLISRFDAASKHTKLICISTRWAETDLAGRFMAQPKTWRTIITPVMDEEGNPTWPEVWDKAAIETAADDNGGFDSPYFLLVYMCDISAISSQEVTLDMFRKFLPHDKDGFLLWEELPKFKEIIISCDFAKKEKESNDWTVFGALARDEEKPWNVYLLDMVRFRKEVVKKRASELMIFYDYIRDNIPEDTPIRVIMEDKDSQAEFQEVQAERADIDVRQIQTKGDKEVRFNQFVVMPQHGRFYVNKKARAYGAMTSECIAFPKASHDDTVDVLSLPFQLDSWRIRRLRASTKKIYSRHLL